MSIESIVNGLEPKEDPIDRRIMYELAGVRLHEQDFRDDSEIEDDIEEMHDENLPSYERMSQRSIREPYR